MSAANVNTITTNGFKTIYSTFICMYLELMGKSCHPFTMYELG